MWIGTLVSGLQVLATSLFCLLKDDVSIDKAAFQLHYKITGVSLMILCFLVSLNQSFGTLMQCRSGSTVPKSQINDYCAMSTSHTLVHHCRVEGQVVPCVPEVEEAAEVPTLDYYNWVSLVLLFQGLCFFLPHHVWRGECGRLRTLVERVRGPFEDDEAKVKGHLYAETYFRLSVEKRSHNGWALKYAAFEALNLTNAVGQMVFVDFFLSGAFLEHEEGYERLDRLNRMMVVFPRVVKCTFFTFGSNETETSSAICLIPGNLRNEKVFLVLYYWFLLLATLSALSFTLTLLSLHAPYFRFRMLAGGATLVETSLVRRLFNKVSFGDCFFLSLAAKSLPPEVFKDLVDVIVNDEQGHLKTIPGASDSIELVKT